MTADLSALTSALHESRAEAVQRLADFEATVRAFAHARGDADGDDEHDPEGSTLAWERAAAAASADAARRHLAEIDTAIARLAGGWDGACARCGQPIPTERLAARPSADRCVTCAAGTP